MKAAFITMLLYCLGQSLHAQEVQRVTTVIPGKLARAGSSNRKPFSDSTLQGLCEQGYTLAIYVYGGAKAHSVSCGKGTISYLSMTNWEHPGSILSKISGEFAAGGKVMVHCWYGVHASNFVTASVLNKSCGFSGQQAASTFRAGVPAKSLSPSRIDALASQIAALGGGGGVMEGCPSPR